MRLGGWESLDMVLRYTRSVKFEESLRLYQAIESVDRQRQWDINRAIKTVHSRRVARAPGEVVD